MRMVGVLVRVEDGVNAVDPRGDQLTPEFGWGVDQQADAAVRFDHGADTRAPVARIGRAADRAVASDLRHPEARSGPQERELHIISTFRLLVVPGTSNGTPAVTTTRSPVLASPWRTTIVRARATISS